MIKNIVKRKLMFFLHCVVFDITCLFEIFGGSKADSLTFDCTPKPILRVLTWIVEWRTKYDSDYDMYMGIVEKSIIEPPEWDK